MKSFLETLNYSSSNEDGSTEIRALQINNSDTILCITGSGARPLDLLIAKPAKIVSIDFNACQNFLLELKIAAIRLLEYEEFLNFIGVNLSQKRERVYKDLRQSLSLDARNFWDNNFPLIEKGIVYQGRWEKYFCKLAQLLHTLCPHLRDDLFNCKSVSEQSKVWHREQNKIIWRTLFRLSTSKLAWKYFFGDPGFYSCIQEGFSIHQYLNRKFTSAFENILVSKSPFATLLFYGKYKVNGALPLHLQGKYYETLREQIACIQIVTQSLQEHLAEYVRNGPNKYSLSDFASYTNIKEYQTVWKEIINASSPGARICERQFLVKRKIPHDVMQFITRNSELEKELATTDDSIFYTFVIAEVKGN